jgi:hypothetical protein
MLRRVASRLLTFLAAALAASSGQAQLVNSEWNTVSGNWNVPGNWFPNDVPDNGGGFTYNVQIGNRPVAANAVVTFIPEDGTGDNIEQLTVSGGVDFLTNGSQLNVNGLVTITGAGTTIRLDPHVVPATPSIQANDLDVTGGAALALNGGVISVFADLDVTGTGVLSGRGTLNVGDADLVVEQAFQNSGTIQVSGTNDVPGTLTIVASGVDTIDLDGDTDTGLVDVSNALADPEADTLTLVIDGPLADGFGAAVGATLQIGQRDTLTFNDDFEIDAGAVITMNGGSHVATLNGPGAITDIADADFTVTGAAVIANNMAFTGTASTFAVAGSGSLTLGGTVTMADASMLSLGAGSQLIVSGATTITEAAGDFNWDGTGNNATTTVETTGHLTLNVDQVDVGDNLFNGTLNLNGNGDLTVNNTINSWQAAGVVNKNGAGTSSINGDEFAVTGDLNVNAGTLDVNADAVFGSTSDIIIAAGAIADMATTEIFNGADITVNGTLSLGAASILEAPATLTGTGLFRFNSTSTVTANAVVNTASFDWDGIGAGTTHTINNGVVFTINSTVWDADDAGDVDDNINLGGNGAQIVVNNVAGWTMARTLNANTAMAGTATIGGTSRLTFAGALAVLNVDGNTNITAPVTFGASSMASIDAAMTLDLGTQATYAGGTIAGAGTFQPAASNLVTSSSIISAATFDFDGGSWTVDPGALLTVNVTDYDTTVTNAFDGTITLNSGDIVVNTADAEFVMNGTLNMNNTAGDVPFWSSLSEPLDIGNDAGSLDADVNIGGSGTSQINAQVDFNSDADVNIAAGAALQFLPSATVNFDTVNGANNAEFTGAGVMRFDGLVNVNEAVTLNMVGGTVDLDGVDNVGDFINVDAPMTINVATMSSFGRVNGGGGVNTLDVNNSVGTGMLTVNLDNADAEWTLNGPGVMNLVNDNTEATLLAGSDLNVNGAINVTGDVRTTARLDIAGVVNINTAGQPFRLAGGNAGPDVNTIGGATITGLGLLGADAAKALHGFGTINADIDFDDTASLRAAGGTLNLTGDIVDVNILGTADNAGVLNILGPWETDGGAGGSIGAVVLAGGILQGGVITNDNLNGIQGNGTVTARVINSSKLVATNGGTLVVQTVGNDNDWDGAGNVGDLEALSADLEMVDTTGPVPPVRSFGGSVRAINNHRVYANGFGLDFNPGSSLTLEDTATYRASSSTDLGGTVTTTAGANATIEVANNFFLTFESTNVTTLGGNLTLKNNNINIEDGATFSGSGALKIPDGSHLVVDNNADVGVLLEMRGAFRPGNFNGIGRVNLTDYQQFDTGELYVEMIGTGLNQFDRLTATGDVIVDGYLNIDIDEIAPMVPFVPVLGNTFNIITSSISVSGQFDYYDVSGMPAGLAFKINYLPNAVQLQVVNKPIFSADFDDDGDVDPTDLQIWKGAYHLNQLGDADGDNDSDGADFLLWQRQAGSHPVVAATQAVPEPSAAALAAAAGLFLTALARRRRELGIDCV